jgi:hypothetical protein
MLELATKGMTNEEYVAALKHSALVIAKKQVMQKLVAAIPFFGLPFFNPLALLIVTRVLETAIMKTEMGLFFLYTDVRVNAQASRFVAAALYFNEAKHLGTAKEAKLAEENMVGAFRNFVKFSS